jgi:hypothetical protein
MGCEICDTGIVCGTRMHIAKSSFCPKKLLVEYGEHNIVATNGFPDYQETRTCLISPCMCVVSAENL